MVTETGQSACRLPIGTGQIDAALSASDDQADAEVLDELEGEDD